MINSRLDPCPHPPRPRALRASFTIVAAFFLLTGCDRTGGAAGAAVATDSAGVALVHNDAPSLGDDTWSLGSEPVFDVGSGEGTEDYWFGEVMGMTRLSSGAVVVADMQRSRLAFYDAEGRFIRAAGRQGSGPGEHRQIMQLHRLRGDSLLVEDFNGFAQLLDSAGAYVRRVPLSANASAPMATGFYRVVGPLADGRLAAVGSGFVVGPEGPPDSSRVYRLAPDGTLEDSILTYPTGWSVRPNGEPVIATFSSREQIAAANDGLYHAGGDAYRVELRNGDGDLQRVITRSWSPERVTDADLAAYRERVVGMRGEDGRETPPTLRAQRERFLADTPTAEHHPPFLRMIVSDDGHVWLQERELEHQLPSGAGGFQQTLPAPARWSVFDPDGVWLTRVTTPANFRVFEVGRDYVLGLARDPLEVEHVQVYELLR